MKASLEVALKEDGELKDNEILKSQKITNAIKTLGYELVRRTGNKPFIDWGNKSNLNAFEANKIRFAIIHEGGPR